MRGFLYSFLGNQLDLIAAMSMIAIGQMWIGGIPHINYLNFVLYALIALWMLFKLRRYCEPIWLILFLFLPLCTLFSDPDPILRPWERCFLFLVMYICFSSLIQSHRARSFRFTLWNYMLILCSVLGVASFFCFFLGINLFENRFEEGEYFDAELGGHFSGLTTHSMVLGPVAALGGLYFFYLAYVKKINVCWLFCGCCLGSCMFASSRAAFMGIIGGLISIIYYHSQGASKTIRRLFIITILGAISFPLWAFALGGLIEKQESHSQIGVFDSRSGKVEDRIDEFLKSPIYGWGISCVDTSYSDRFLAQTGNVEPGSSWLAILSMTGIVGFILVLRVFKRAFNYCRRARDNSLYMGIFIFFCIHMMAEGYIFAGGNTLSVMLWLTVACCYDKKNESL